MILCSMLSSVIIGCTAAACLIALKQSLLSADQCPLIDTEKSVSCHEDASVYSATPVAAGVLTIHHSSAVHEVREAIAQAATPAPSISPKAGEC